MKNSSLQENNPQNPLLALTLAFLSLGGWGYFLFLWIFLGYKWEVFPLEVSLHPVILSFIKISLFFKVCCGLVILGGHVVLLKLKNKSRQAYLFLSLMLSFVLIAEQFIFVLNPVRVYRNTLKVNMKASPANLS